MTDWAVRHQVQEQSREIEALKRKNEILARCLASVIGEGPIQAELLQQLSKVDYDLQLRQYKDDDYADEG